MHDESNHRRDVLWATAVAVLVSALYLVTLRADVGGTEDSPKFQFLGQVLGYCPHAGLSVLYHRHLRVHARATGHAGIPRQPVLRRLRHGVVPLHFLDGTANRRVTAIVGRSRTRRGHRLSRVEQQRHCGGLYAFCLDVCPHRAVADHLGTIRQACVALRCLRRVCCRAREPFDDRRLAPGGARLWHREGSICAPAARGGRGRHHRRARCWPIRLHRAAHPAGGAISRSPGDKCSRHFRRDHRARRVVGAVLPGRGQSGGHRSADASRRPPRPHGHADRRPRRLRRRRGAVATAGPRCSSSPEAPRERLA